MLGEKHVANPDSVMAIKRFERISLFHDVPSRYLLDSAPSLGDQIAWGESNAVVFARTLWGTALLLFAPHFP